MQKPINLGIKEKRIAYYNKIMKIMPCFLTAFKNFYYIAFITVSQILES